jgi:hypothetical protein
LISVLLFLSLRHDTMYGYLRINRTGKKERVITKSEAISLVEEIPHSGFYVTNETKETVIGKIQSQRI